jgi:class 3 adenylate cyclase/tetratricopeptide (TPR) repeat protein
MQCFRCKSENPAEAKFCDQCGERLDWKCPGCGETNRTSARFCKKCGQRLETALPPAGEAVNPSANNLDVPKHLAEKILASRRFIEGERKQVTVLFADIKRAPTLIERLDPEEVRRHIDPLLNIMIDAVHRYEGTVNQVLGDGIMALFGVPLAHEDHAVRSCYAALAMQEEVRRHLDRLGQADDTGLKIGINSGEVVVRSISNDLNFDYSALGHTTHLAARMEELAAPGTILLTAASAREVEGFVELKTLPAVEAKGVSQPVAVFELVGATSARTRLQAAARRGLTPFVGRQAEIELFQRLVEKAASGGGQILAMLGEAGMGKSRLVHEFTQNHLPPDWRVVEATSVSYGKATAYFPVTELLRRYFSVSEGQTIETIQAKVVEMVLKLDVKLTDTIAPILTLLDALPGRDRNRAAGRSSFLDQHSQVVEAITKFNDMEPQQRRRHTLDGLKRILMRESQKQPLLLVFEDLQWIDNETQALLDNLADGLAMARIVLLVNYRLGYNHGWADKTYYNQFRVDPLPPTGAAELLQSLLGQNEELAAIKKLVIERTEGNPFFVEEIVRSLVEAGFLSGSKGEYRPGLRIDSIRIPATVQTLLADRIDRLPVEEKNLLQTAAAVGVIVPLRLLGKVAGLPEDELYRCLTSLQAAEFLYESNLFPELEYTFKHALTNEVAYGALLHERRTALHGRTLGALEDLVGDRLDDHVESLAHHALRGELWEKAVVYQRQAGNRAMSRSAFLEGLSSYQRAFEALDHLPDCAEKLARQIDLHLDARNVLFLLGDLPRVGEHLRAAESFAETLGDEQRTARVLNFLNSYYGLVGDPERAIEIGQRALSLNTVRSDPAASAVTYYYLGAAFNKTGQYDQAIANLMRGVQNVDGDLRHKRLGTAAVLSVTCRSHLAQCLAEIGKFSEGASYGEEGVRIAEEANHPASLIHIMCSLGVLHLMKGDFARAISVLEHGLQVCQSANISVYLPLVSSRLGSAYANSGRITDAIVYLEQGVEDHTSAGRVAFLSLSTIWLGEGYLLSGRVEEARAQAESALDLSRKHKERGHEAWGLKLLGDILLRGGPIKLAEAETCYRRAFRVSHELGMRPLQAHCNFGLGQVYAATGAVSQARTELRAAINLYRSMDMAFWAPRAESALKNLCS